MLERMKDRYGVEVKTRPPKIAYRETIGGEGRRPSPPQEADRRRGPVRRSVPAHRAAAARRRLRIRRRGQGRHDPGPVHPGGRERRAPGAGHGAIAGYPLQDVRVIVYDGKYHPVDSKEVAFVSRRQVGVPGCDRQGAAAGARADRATWTCPCPEAHMGDVTGGLASKRARISGTDSLRGGEIIVKAQVPLVRSAATTRPNSRRDRRARAATRWSSATTSRCRRRCRSSWWRRTSPTRTRTERPRAGAAGTGARASRRCRLHTH